MPDPRPTFRDIPNDPIFQALASGKGRSPVYRWLRDRHEAVAAALARVGSRPNWAGLGDLMALEGVLDGRGNAPCWRVVRDQWREVCGDLMAEHRLATVPEPERPWPTSVTARPSLPSAPISSPQPAMRQKVDPVLEALRADRIKGGSVL